MIVDLDGILLNDLYLMVMPDLDILRVNNISICKYTL